MNARRINHLARVGTFALFAKSSNGEDFVLDTWDVKDVHQPKNGPLYFVLPDALTSPPGEYEVQARLYADAPWGQGLFPVRDAGGQPVYHAGDTYDEQKMWIKEAHFGPAIPGQFVVRTMDSDRLTVVIEEPQD